MITGTNHMREQIVTRFQGKLGITPEHVIEQVNATVNPLHLLKQGENWVRVAVLDKPITFPASTAHGQVNGDNLIAVIRWNEKRECFRIATVMLRRDSPVSDDIRFWNAKDLQSITV